mmetsp:Transcript_17598/g.52964  ORF Transcript_17598/g.52964 Transcript_17598/m.52964 type:complete len:218 (-) Transcript_17598:376-1029(-)
MKSRPHQESCCSSQASNEALNSCTRASRQAGATLRPAALSSSVGCASRLSTSVRSTWQRAARSRGSARLAFTCSSCSLHWSAASAGASCARSFAKMPLSSVSISCLMYCCTSSTTFGSPSAFGRSFSFRGTLQKPRAASGTPRPSGGGVLCSRMKACRSKPTSADSPAFTVASRSYCMFRSQEVSKTASFIRPSVTHLPRLSSMSCRAERMRGRCAS